jgi:hypothetical protein
MNKGEKEQEGSSCAGNLQQSNHGVSSNELADQSCPRSRMSEWQRTVSCHSSRLLVHHIFFEHVV